MRIKTLTVCTAAALLFAGCSLAPEMKTPKVELPSSFDKNGDKNVTIDVAWWKNFNDENLNVLIGEALKNNDDLKLAVANVQKARAQYGLSEAEMYPQLDMDASASREKKSINTYTGTKNGSYNNYGVSASVAYEIDFWGRAQNQKNADLSLLLASDADKEALRISVVVDVATYYFNLISVNERLSIAKKSLMSYEESLQYKQMQLKHGVVDELVVAQAEAQVSAADTLVQTIESEKIKIQSALALLLGRTPKEIFEKMLIASKTLPSAIEIPAGIPAKILENRPDIKAAEETLRAKTAFIGVAKAAYFPSISLTGSYGYQSQNLDNLVSGNSSVWGIGPSLNIPLFDFGRIKAAVQASKADQKAALISYDKAVKTAYKEVYDSLGSIRISKLKSASADREIEAYDKAYMLASKKFERGTASYLDVLLAQEGLLNAKLSGVDAYTQLLIDEVTLYKSLGGGWSRHYDSNVTQADK
ncbi:efflux transporter outer membrane subunit [Sulfurimonas sp. HSL-1716]|uniref:efflux transporter outer membrane subunit n=1 Tax=Hydrocurvibacter sulfurireducens TaxID=3131937 RepID=UPI0031F7486E